MSLTRLIHFQLKDYNKSLFVLWGILIIVDICLQSFVQFGFLGDEIQVTNQVAFEMQITSLDVVQSNFAPIVNLVATGIFMLVAGIMTAAQTFPLMRSLNVSRTRIIHSSALGLGAASTIMVIIQTIISVVFALVLSAPDIMESVLNPSYLLSYWSILIMVSIAFYLVGAVFYRYGTWIGIISLVVVGNVISWLPFDSYLASMSLTLLIAICWIVTALFYALTYALLIRARIKA